MNLLMDLPSTTSPLVSKFVALAARFQLGAFKTTSTSLDPCNQLCRAVAMTAQWNPPHSRRLQSIVRPRRNRLASLSAAPIKLAPDPVGRRNRIFSKPDQQAKPAALRLNRRARTPSSHPREHQAHGRRRPVPAGLGGGELPLPIPHVHLDLVAPPPRAPEEPASGGAGQDKVPVLPAAQGHLGGTGRGIYDRQGMVGASRSFIFCLSSTMTRSITPRDCSTMARPRSITPWDCTMMARTRSSTPWDCSTMARTWSSTMAPTTSASMSPKTALKVMGMASHRIVGRGRHDVGALEASWPWRAALLPVRRRGRGRGRGREHRGTANVDLYGPGANRPDAKGRIVPRLGRKFQSEDDAINSINYDLQKLYRQLQERKSDAQEADMMFGRKAALSIAKDYAKGLSKAEGLRSQIARAGGAPVGKPKDQRSPCLILFPCYFQLCSDRCSETGWIRVRSMSSIVGTD